MDSRRAARTFGAAVLLCAALLLTPAGCEGPSSPSAEQLSERMRQIQEQPTVRVRIRRGIEHIRIDGPSRVQVRPVDAPDQQQLLPTPLTLQRIGGQWAGPWGGDTPAPDQTLIIAPLGPRPITLDDTPYPGQLRLVPTGSSASSLNHFDAVSHVDLETYVAGVTQEELYSHWHPATFFAQAIAARTYAINRLIQHGKGRHFDLESTQASQVYRGRPTHPLAIQAAADSAGLVLTWRGHAIIAYYSSTCGGVGISPRDAFGASYDIPPLHPKGTRDWCRDSKYYRWGPVERDRDQLSKRIRHWGRRLDTAVKDLGTLRSLRISERNAHGRPTAFILEDERGRRFQLRPDSLRRAANFADASAGLPALDRSRQLKSGFFAPAVEGNYVIFRDGRGFGHGVGLCQYGAEGMARANYEPPKILAEFYPNAEIDRAY